jgi:hypothetical protein
MPAVCSDGDNVSNVTLLFFSAPSSRWISFRLVRTPSSDDLALFSSRSTWLPGIGSEGFAA